MNNLVVIPILIPLVTALLLLFFRKNIFWQRVVSIISALLALGVSILLAITVAQDGIQVSQIGNWPAPYGITMVADLFSAIMVMLSAVMAIAIIAYSFNYIDRKREEYFYYPLLQLVLMGINGSFLTGDIFNLFVFFEILLIGSYMLLSLGGEKYQLQEAVKYMIINILASSLFLVAIALLYGVTGTLNMADLAVKIAALEDTRVITVISMLFFAVFAIKAALFPLYFWLPGSYHAPPTPITTLFAALLTKVGVYALVRTFTLIFVQDVSFTHTVILVIAGFTMSLGVLGAVAQMDFKRILAYHSISQVGYMVMGLGLYTVTGLVGTIFFIVHHSLIKSSLFLISGITEKITGTTDLRKLGGLLTAFPLVGWLFFIASFALAGTPPLSGFFSKFLLIKAGLDIGQHAIVAVSILVGTLTLFSMVKIFYYAFWGKEPHKYIPKDGTKWVRLTPAVIYLITLSALIGVNFEWFYSYALMASEQLMNPEIYIEAVLGRGGH